MEEDEGVNRDVDLNRTFSTVVLESSDTSVSV